MTVSYIMTNSHNVEVIIMAIADRKRREFERREEDILTAAFELFTEKGLEAVTIEMIADAAEIGKGTIYKHFNSKHEIFASIAIRRGNEMLKIIQRGIDGSAPVMDQIRSLIRITWDKFIEDPKEYYIHKKCENMLAEDNLGLEVFKKLQKVREQNVSLATVLLQKAIDEGLIIDEPVEYIFLIGYGLILGTIELLGSYPVEDTERLYKLMEKAIIDGMIKK